MIQKIRPLYLVAAALALLLMSSCATNAVVKPDNCVELQATYQAAKDDASHKRSAYEACEKEKCRPSRYTLRELYQCWYGTCADEWWPQEEARQAAVDAYVAFMPCLGLKPHPHKE